MEKLHIRLWQDFSRWDVLLQMAKQRHWDKEKHLLGQLSYQITFYSLENMVHICYRMVPIDVLREKKAKEKIRWTERGGGPMKKRGAEMTSSRGGKSPSKEESEHRSSGISRREVWWTHKGKRVPGKQKSRRCKKHVEKIPKTSNVAWEAGVRL